METVEYYNDNDTDCYLLLLDASKAFDRVEYVKLFTILRDRKFCAIVLRLTTLFGSCSAMHNTYCCNSYD